MRGDSHDTTRAPCPDRIIDDVGGAFAMGAIGGSFFHFARGIYNSPKGERFFGGAQAIRMNAPRVGGGFAPWGGLYSIFDCSMVYLRQKEDPWNPIAAGGAAAGLLQLRQGLRAASRSALVGAVLLAMIEGTGVMMTKVLEHQGPPIFGDDLPAGAQERAPATTSSSSWFGGKKEAEKETKISGEILESFDSPIPPNFEFE